MGRTSKFIHNSVSTAFYQLCHIAYGFLVPRIMLVYYGSEINGLVSSINQIITYLNLVEAGLAGAAVFALYKPLATKDVHEINGVVSAARKYYNQSGLLFTGLILAVAVIYPILKPVSGLSPIVVGLLILILGAKGFLELFTLAKYRALLTADQKTYVISNTSSLYVILNTGCIVLLTRMGCHIVLVYLLALSALFARSIFLLVYVRRNYRYLDFSVPPKTNALEKRWDAFFLQILGAVHTGGPLVLATFFFNLANVSVYSVYHTVIAGINSLLGIFTSGLSAAFGDVISRGELKMLQKASNDFEVAYYMLITMVYSIAYTMMLPFVLVYTAGITDTNYYLPLLSSLIVTDGLLYNLKTPQGMLVISAGHYRETRWRTTTQAVLSIGLGIAFIPLIGLPGIALGACLSNLYRDIDLAFYIPKHVTKTNPKRTLRRMVWVVGTYAASVLVCSMLPVQADSYVEWVVWACVCGMIAVSITLISALLFERNTVKSILLRAKALLQRKPQSISQDGGRLAMKEEIILFDRKEACCGCSACYSICPTGAITMEPDEEGFLYPVIDTAKCIRCRQCLSVCAFKSDQQKKGYL